MEVANASMYDGSTGAAEAVMMAVRLPGAARCCVARNVHPEYREVLATYAHHQGTADCRGSVSVKMAALT